MSLEIFARQSLAQFTIIYGEIFDGKAIQPSELETLMWGRMCAKEAGIVKTGFKIPYDNIKRAKVTLPYMPHDINYTGCPVIKKNGGLYTPCCGKVAEDEFYCKTCSVDKEGNVKDLEFGTTETRETNIEDEQFAPITFAEWMKGHKMTLPEVYSKLRDAGIAIEIPATELVCRELPKRRKGRPAKSDDSVVDEDSVEPKAAAKKAKKPKAESDSEDEAPKVKAEAPKKKAKSSEDEAPKKKTKSSEDEAPKKKAKSPAPSDEAPKKAKSPAPSEDDKAKKPKKAAPKVESDSEEEFDVKVASAKKPKAEKAEKPKAEKPKAEKPKAEKPKAEKPKAEKPKAEKPKPKASSGSENDTPKKKKAEPKPEPKPEVEVEEDEEEEDVEQEIEIDGKDYMLRNGKFICDMDGGRILGTVNDEGEPEWSA